MKYEKNGKFYTVNRGFNTLAFLIPPLNFILKDMYLIAFTYLLIAFILVTNLDGFNLFKVLFYLHIVYGLFSNPLQRFYLKKRGYTEFDPNKY